MNLAVLKDQSIRNIRKHKYLVLAAIIAFILIFPGMNFLGRYYGFGINTTISEPRGIYIYSPAPTVLHKGQFVMATMPWVSWIAHRDYVVKGEKIIKKVVATSGEWLFTTNNTVYGCQKNQLDKSCHVLSLCQRKDEQGKPVFCQQWAGYQIPKNYYYLASNQTKLSLDSRYFGLVSRNAVLHKVKLLWRF